VTAYDHRGSLTRQTGNALSRPLKRPLSAQRRSRQGYVRAPLDAVSRRANTTQRHKPSRETLAAFACATRNIFGESSPRENYLKECSVPLDEMGHANRARSVSNAA
jgi:hypothetical protein